MRSESSILRSGAPAHFATFLAFVLALGLAPMLAGAQEEGGEPTPLVIEGPQPTTARELLEMVREGWEVEKREDVERERRFETAKGEQAELLQQAKAREARAEARSQALELEYQEKEVQIAEMEEALTNRLGNLGELFGVTRQIAGDTRGQLEASITSAQFSDERLRFLEELGKSKELPSIAALERLWAEMLNEMVEQGSVVEFSAPVLSESGAETRSVVRAGVFSAISDGEYLLWDPNVGKLQQLSRQPPARFQSTVGDYMSSTEALAGLAVDPSRGSLLAVLIETRGLVERLPDGGAVGYTIIALGSVAALLAVVRMLIIFVVGRKVEAQKKNSRPDKGNPLGRVLSVSTDNPDVDREQLELMLDEAVLRETSKLESRSRSLVRAIRG
jgi:biopolymer transport protein ExbB